MLAVDLSEASRHAMHACIPLARDLNARVVVVHAFPQPPRRGDYMMAVVYPSTVREQVADEIEHAIALTNQWAAELRAAGLDVTTAAKAESPVQLVLDIAANERTSLIVAGTHGKSGLRRFGLGSVAQELVRRSHVPVLVVPAGGK